VLAWGYSGLPQWLSLVILYGGSKLHSTLLKWLSLSLSWYSCSRRVLVWFYLEEQSCDKLLSKGVECINIRNQLLYSAAFRHLLMSFASCNRWVGPTSFPTNYSLIPAQVLVGQKVRITTSQTSLASYFN
jgi:hypothetical protein